MAVFFCLAIADKRATSAKGKKEEFFGKDEEEEEEEIANVTNEQICRGVSTRAERRRENQ